MALGRPGLALRIVREESSGIYEQVNYRAEKHKLDSMLIATIHKQEFIFCSFSAY